MKRILLASALVAAFLAVGCDSSVDDGPDYYPTAVGNHWRYTGTITSDDIDADTIATTVNRIEVVGTAAVATGDQAAVTVATDSIFYLGEPEIAFNVDTSWVVKKDNKILIYDELDDPSPLTLLALPLERGKTWQAWTDDEGEGRATVVAREDLTVPAGTFEDCWKIALTFIHSGEEHDAGYFWFAAEIGPARVLMYNSDIEGLEIEDIRLVDYDIK